MRELASATEVIFSHILTVTRRRRLEGTVMGRYCALNALPYVKVLGDFAILDDLVEEYQNVMLELDAGVHQQLIGYFVISTGFATRKILEHLTQLKESVWGTYLIFKLGRVDGWCCA